MWRVEGKPKGNIVWLTGVLQVPSACSRDCAKCWHLFLPCPFCGVWKEGRGEGPLWPDSILGFPTLRHI